MPLPCARMAMACGPVPRALFIAVILALEAALEAVLEVMHLAPRGAAPRDVGHACCAGVALRIVGLCEWRSLDGANEPADGRVAGGPLQREQALAIQEIRALCKCRHGRVAVWVRRDLRHGDDTPRAHALLARECVGRPPCRDHWAIIGLAGRLSTDPLTS